MLCDRISNGIQNKKRKSINECYGYNDNNNNRINTIFNTNKNKELQSERKTNRTETNETTESTTNKIREERGRTRGRGEEHERDTNRECEKYEKNNNDEFREESFDEYGLPSSINREFDELSQCSQGLIRGFSNESNNDFFNELAFNTNFETSTFI